MQFYYLLEKASSHRRSSLHLRNISFFSEQHQYSKAVSDDKLINTVFVLYTSLAMFRVDVYNSAIVYNASLKDFNIPTESWEQIAQDRTKWRGLIKRGAGEYEAKRISETEQKRAQRKARAKASPTELSSSDLSCSICNRQFRAKIGLISLLEHTNNNTSHS